MYDLSWPQCCSPSLSLLLQRGSLKSQARSAPCLGRVNRTCEAEAPGTVGQMVNQEKERRRGREREREIQTERVANMQAQIRNRERERQRGTAREKKTEIANP